MAEVKLCQFQSEPLRDSRFFCLSLEALSCSVRSLTILRTPFCKEVHACHVERPWGKRERMEDSGPALDLFSPQKSESSQLSSQTLQTINESSLLFPVPNTNPIITKCHTINYWFWPLSLGSCSNKVIRTPWGGGKSQEEGEVVYMVGVGRKRVVITGQQEGS